MDEERGIIRLDEGPELYWKLYNKLAPALKVLHRIECRRPENLVGSGDGGVIIAALHNGPLDAALISLAAAERGRAIRWVADEGACNAPLVGSMVRGVGCIPIASVKGAAADPEKVRESLAEAAKALEYGGAVGLFPEGVIHPFFKNRATFPFKTGVIRLALASGAPIVPTWAKGAGFIFPWLKPVAVRNLQLYMALPLWLPAKVDVHFGEQFFVDPGLTLDSPAEALRAETERLRRAVDRLIGASVKTDFDD